MVISILPSLETCSAAWGKENNSWIVEYENPKREKQKHTNKQNKTKKLHTSFWIIFDCNGGDDVDGINDCVGGDGVGCGLIDSDGKDVSAVKVEDSNEAADIKFQISHPPAPPPPPPPPRKQTSKQTLLKNRNNLRRNDLEMFAQVKILSWLSESLWVPLAMIAVVGVPNVNS